MKKAKEDQILEMIKQSASVLICIPEHPTTDAIASSVALLSSIEKLGKRGKIVSSGYQVPPNHTFLPKSNEIFDDLSAMRKFIVSLDLSNKSVEELTYNIDGEKLNIYISPKDGFFTKNDVRTSDGDYAFDLIIVIDAADLESLGRIYEMNADFFYHTPVVNIDQSPANDHFGQVNLVNVTATSTSEIIFELIKDWGEQVMDEYIATSLLSGMISKTKSFQSGSVTPRSLSIASHLISQGARREEIVKHLYQSKKISTLKLWGRVLSTLQVDEERKIVWSQLYLKDFEEVGASEHDLPDVIDELIINTPDAKNVFIVYNIHPNEVKAVVSTAPYINAIELFREFNPVGTEHFVRFNNNHDQTVEDVARMVHGRLRDAVQPQ